MHCFHVISADACAYASMGKCFALQGSDKKPRTRAKVVYSLIEMADAGRTANRSIDIDIFQRSPLFSDAVWSLFIVYANRPPDFFLFSFETRERGCSSAAQTSEFNRYWKCLSKGLIDYRYRRGLVCVTVIKSVRRKAHKIGSVRFNWKWLEPAWWQILMRLGRARRGGENAIKLIDIYDRHLQLLSGYINRVVGKVDQNDESVLIAAFNTRCLTSPETYDTFLVRNNAEAWSTL